MKFQFYYEKLIDSKEYRQFKKENPEAFFCSAFFVLDNEKEENKVNFDFYLPKTPKIFSFKLNETVEFTNVENFDKRFPEELPLNFDFDLKEIQKKIESEMENRKIKSKIQKSLFSLQRLKKQDYILATIFLSNMALLKVTIKIPQNEITEFEKKSFLDMIKIVKGKKDKKEN